MMAKKGKKAATASATPTTSTRAAGNSAKSAIEKPAVSLPESLLVHENRNRHGGRVLRLEPLQNGADVYVARNFLSLTECRAWIDFVEQSGELEYVSHPATRYNANRECSRWQRNDWHFADLIFQRLVATGILHQFQSNLSSFPSSRCRTSHAGNKSSYIPVACNGNLRLYKYEKGMSFGRHVDECNDTQRGQTEVTILIYLSSCQGGATRFHSATMHNISKKGTTQKSSSSSSSFAFVPEAGSILLHVHGDQCLEHEADPVVSGIKYVLRTDLVYAQVQDNNSDDNRYCK
jgi:2OG-Fe(II) oxygenase superfamily